MNTILQKRIEEAVKKTACPQCVFNDGGTCNNDDDCKLFDDFVGLMTFALQNQWISVEEALPEYKEPIIVKKGTEYAFASFQNGNFYIVGNIGKIDDVTHWMLIPTINNEEK